MMNIKLPYKVPADLKMEILEFCKQDNLNFIEHGNETFGYVINKFVKFDDIDDPLSDKVKRFADDLFESMGMVTTEIETYNGYCVSITENEGYTQEHIDPKHSVNQFPHIRLNFLLSKPVSGGDPIINGTVYEMQEDEGWFNHASIWRHGTTKVTGDKPRITLSVGKHVKPSEVTNFLKTFLFR